MVDCKCVVTRFPLKAGGGVMLDPTPELIFIPDADMEFLCLLGLEEVVRFRLELLDTIVFNGTKKHKGKGKKKSKEPTASEVKCPSPKDPLICAQCSTDFSCSWEQIGDSFLCQPCFKCSWRKEHWCTGNFASHIPASSSQHVSNDPEGKQVAAFPLVTPSASAFCKVHKVPRMSAFSISPDDTSSSSSSLPYFYSDPSSSVPSSSSSDPLSSSICHSLSSSYGSSSPYLYSSSEYNSSSSSLSPSPPYSSQNSVKKARAPYCVDTTDLQSAKSLLKDGKVKQETVEERNRCLAWNSPLNSSEKSKVCSTFSVMASTKKTTPVLSACKQKVETHKLMPNLKKTSKEEPTSQTLLKQLSLGQGRLQKASFNLSQRNLCTAAPGTSPAGTSHSAKFKESWAVSRPKDTSVKWTSSKHPTLGPTSSNLHARKDPPFKQKASDSAAPGSFSTSSHSAKSSKYLPKYLLDLTQPAVSKTFPGSVGGIQQANSKPGCDECKSSPLISPTNALSSQQEKTPRQAVVL